MLAKGVKGWLKGLRQRSARPVQKTARAPKLEELESRFAPAGYNPDVFTDSVSGNTLRNAILQANGNGQDNVITLGAGVYSLTLTGRDDAGLMGDLDITANPGHTLTIVGVSSTATVIDGSQLGDRIFDIFGNVTVVFQNLTISGGTASDGGSVGGTDALGGGLLINGASVTLDHVAVVSNIALGNSGSGGGHGEGGGIAALSGQLYMSNAIILGNAAIGGSGFNAAPGDPGGSGGTGWSGQGGGIYAVNSSVNLYDYVDVSSNLALGGMGGVGGAGTPGVDGDTRLTFGFTDYKGGQGHDGGQGGTGGAARGGGIFAVGGSVYINGSTFDENVAVGGKGGKGGSGGVGGAGAHGGGSHSRGGDGGDGGIGGTGGTGGVAQGGGLFVASNLTMSLTTVSNNEADGGWAGLGGDGGQGGKGGLADLPHSAAFLFWDLSGAGNGGAGGNGGTGGNGGAGQGGGLYASNTSPTINQVSIYGNSALGGRGAPGGLGGAGGVGGDAELQGTASTRTADDPFNAFRFDQYQDQYEADNEGFLVEKTATAAVKAAELGYNIYQATSPSGIAFVIVKAVVFYTLKQVFRYLELGSGAASGPPLANAPGMGGRGGDGGSGGNGGSALGGGVYYDVSEGRWTNVTIDSNSATGGSSGSVGSGGSGAPYGRDANDGLRHGSLAPNGGSGYFVGTAGTGDAGGAYLYASGPDIYFSTITSNSAPGSGRTGGLLIDGGGRPTIANTIIYYNAGQFDLLYTDPINTPIFAGSNLIRGYFGSDPRLGVLQDNGGRVWTRVPQVGSPAIDGVNTQQGYFIFGLGGLPSTDARGYSRTVGTALNLGGYLTQAADIGAAEYQFDLAVTSKVAMSIQADEDLTFIVTITNNGPDAADAFAVVDPIPGNSTFVSILLPPGWSTTVPPSLPAVGQPGNVILTHDGGLAPGASISYQLTVHVSSTALATTAITNTPSVQPSHPQDSNLANNSQSKSA
ncbi:MAG: choice-of-anchor Q domain-containing protein, partial [Gemmataceae bacterium]